MIRFRSISTANRHGFTSTELLITTVVMGFLIAAMVQLFMGVKKGMTGFDAANAMKKINTESLTRMHLKVSRSKRLFNNVSADNAFLSKLDLGGCPVVIGLSKLPKIEDTGSLVPGATNYYASSFGNSLFEAYNDAPETMTNIVVTAPSSTGTVKVNIYRFAYYYLTQDHTQYINSKQPYLLTEWTSQPYADYNELNVMGSPQKSNVVKALVARNVIYAWNPSTGVATAAFYTLTSGGAMNLSASHTIQKRDCTVLTAGLKNRLGQNYTLGVAVNNDGFGGLMKAVPQFAAPDGIFPGGLEVGIVGPAGGRKVLLHHVLFCGGVQQKVISDDRISVTAARDIW